MLHNVISDEVTKQITNKIKQILLDKYICIVLDAIAIWTCFVGTLVTVRPFQVVAPHETLFLSYGGLSQPRCSFTSAWFAQSFLVNTLAETVCTARKLWFVRLNANRFVDADNMARRHFSRLHLFIFSCPCCSSSQSGLLLSVDLFGRKIVFNIKLILIQF